MSENNPDPEKEDKEYSSIDIGGPGGNVKLISTIQSIGPGEGEDGPSIAGIKPEAVLGGLQVLEKLGIKDDIEEGIKVFDDDTKEERTKETKLITARINQLDVFITVGLYYASLMVSWLTQLGDSESAQDFFIKLFFTSFKINEWDFGDLDLVGKISGATTTLQTSLFGIVGLTRLVYTALKKDIPKFIDGPMYFGGPFQILHVIVPKSNDYIQSIRSFDARLSQLFGVISQILIIVAAIYAIGYRNEALEPFTTGNETAIGQGYQPGPDTEDQNGDQIQPGNSTHITLAVKNAALFARATYMVSICAIIMTSLLNIVQWMADAWRLNKDELIVYTAFKLITRLLLCQPCFGDDWLKKRTAKSKGTKQTEDQELLLEKKSQDPGGKKGGDSKGGGGNEGGVEKGGNVSEEGGSEKDKEENKGGSEEKELSEKT
nr:10192_t:CDS:1 [Entrophospora candida]